MTVWPPATVPDLYLNVIQPATYEIGRHWQQNKLIVAEQHIAADDASGLTVHVTWCTVERSVRIGCSRRAMSLRRTVRPAASTTRTPLGICSKDGRQLSSELPRLFSCLDRRGDVNR
jgi:hypothetical protein